MGTPVYNIPKRERDLFLFLRPFLIGREINTVLDYECGYSPLASYIAGMQGVRLIGFDENEEAIVQLENLFPGGKWFVSRSCDFHVPAWPPINIVMWLGIDPSERPATMAASCFVEMVVGEIDPLYVFLEWASDYARGKRAMTEVMGQLRHVYGLVDSGTTRLGFGQLIPGFAYSERSFTLYMKL